MAQVTAASFPVQAGGARRDRTETEMSTRFSYMYRDGDNYKTGTAYVLAGEASEADRRLIAGKLDDGQFFIPSQVGLRDLQEDLAVYNGGTMTDSDHVWHELDLEFDVTAVADRPRADAPLTWAELVARFAAVEEWDVAGASTRLGIPP